MSDSDCSRPDSRTFWPCMNVYHAPCRKNDEYARKLKRENAQYRRWLKVLVNPMSIATRIETWTEIRAKLPDLFKAKRRGSK